MRYGLWVMGRRITHHASRITHNAFTLIEVMLSIAILSLGLVLILQFFAHSLNILQASGHYLRAADLLEERITDLEIQFKEGTRVYADTEEFEDSDISFKLQRDVENVECKKELESGEVVEFENLYKLDTILSWKEGRRKGSIPIATYLIKKSIVDSP